RIGVVIDHQPPRHYRRHRPARLTMVLALASVLAVLLAACGGRSQSPGPAGTGAPTAPAKCTQKVSDSAALNQALSSASAGDTICVAGDLGKSRVNITKGGSDGQPISVIGNKTPAGGISVEADNVVVDGFVLDQPQAPGAELRGNNITLRNTWINDPQDGDNDGIRFFGNGIKILHNTVAKTAPRNKSHADCMQTFATDSDHPASQDVLIDGNRCEQIDNNCLIAEGPNSSADDGSGEGESKNITFSNNYCENHAAQAVLLDDVTGAVITGNQIAGRTNHAFALQNNSTGAVIKDNKITGRVKYEVGMDEDSEQNYQGPPVGGEP
ncbi:MAG TPA: hypothetical protein VGH89_22200, partial [Pseudonocardia sp.]